MREKIIAFLEEICQRTDIVNKTNLVDGDILDSISIVRLVDALESEFKVEISVDDLAPENLNSVDAIQRMVERLLLDQ